MDKLKANHSETDSNLQPKAKNVVENVRDGTRMPFSNGSGEYSGYYQLITAKKEEKKTKDKSLSPPACKKLKLEVIQEGAIPKGTIIHITPNGLIGSKRTVNDGIVYFGTEAPGVNGLL